MIARCAASAGVHMRTIMLALTSSTLRAAEPSAELVEPIRDSARDLPFPGVSMWACPEPLDGGLVKNKM